MGRAGPPRGGVAERAWGGAEGQGEGGTQREQAGGVKEGTRLEKMMGESLAVLGVPPRRELGAYTLRSTSARAPVTLRRAEGRGLKYRCPYLILFLAGRGTGAAWPR